MIEHNLFTKRASTWLQNIILSSFLVSCATINMPDGGDKDTKAPVVLSTNPDSAQVNYRGQSVEIEFDEFIVIKDFNQQVLISPPFDKPVTYKLKGKKLHIDFPAYPLINTTYQINFGEAISDLNEGNILKDFQLVFSSGNTIDSAALKGSVAISPLIEKLESNLKIFLYPNYSDTNLITGKPYYVTTASENGSFKFHHLKTGDYQVVALDDKNKNYRYEIGEYIATLYRKINTDTSFEKLVLFEEQAVVKSSIKKIKSLSRLNYAVFGDGLENLQNISLKSSSNKRSSISFLPLINNDTCKFFLEPLSFKDDSLILSFAFKDTSIERTLYKKDLSKKRFSQNLRTSNGYQSPKPPIKFTSNFPLSVSDSSKIAFYNMKDSLALQLAYKISQEYTFDLLPYTGNFDEEQAILLVIDSNFFNIPYHNYHDSIYVKTQNQKSTSKLDFELKNEANSPIILQLLSNTNIVKEWITSSDTTISSWYLTPGKYRLIAIIDENEDGLYTSGSLKLKRQPERVILLEKSLELKADWEVKDLEYIIK